LLLSAAVQQSIDISQQTRRTLPNLSIDARQTDGRTDTVALHRPCRILCQELVNIRFARNFRKNLPAKKMESQSKFDRIVAISLVCSFLAHPIEFTAMEFNELQFT